MARARMFALSLSPVRHTDGACRTCVYVHGACSQDGHVLILFGPHIAVSKSGELGKYHRIGQAKESGSCGAVLAAYDQCCNPKDGVQMAFDMDDMQQSWLRQGICPRVGEAQAASDPLKVVTDIAYDVVRDKLLRIVNNNFGKGKLVLLGGIQINMPEPYDDHFQPKMFKVPAPPIPPRGTLCLMRALLAYNGITHTRASSLSHTVSARVRVALSPLLCMLPHCSCAQVISKDGSEVDLLDSLNCSCDDMMKVVDCEPNSDVFTKVVN